MKQGHKAVIWFTVVMISVICIIIAINNSNGGSGGYEAEPVTNEHVYQLRYTVTKEYIENTVVLKGVAVNHNTDESVVVSAEADERSEVQIKCSMYDEVKKGDVLFTIGTKEYKSTVSGKVREIINEEGYVAVSVLNYDDIMIDAGVNYVISDKMKIGDTIKVREVNPASEKVTFDEKIVGFGFEVSENMIPVYITNSQKFMPGTEFEAEFTYQNDIETCYILKDMLLKDIEGYYVNVEKNGERVKRKVETGAEFASYNGEIKTEFIEITAGLEEGEKIVIDIYE